MLSPQARHRNPAHGPLPPRGMLDASPGGQRPLGASSLLFFPPLSFSCVTALPGRGYYRKNRGKGSELTPRSGQNQGLNPDNPRLTLLSLDALVHDLVHIAGVQKCLLNENPNKGPGEAHGAIQEAVVRARLAGPVRAVLSSQGPCHIQPSSL